MTCWQRSLNFKGDLEPRLMTSSDKVLRSSQVITAQSFTSLQQKTMIKLIVAGTGSRKDCAAGTNKSSLQLDSQNPVLF